MALNRADRLKVTLHPKPCVRRPSVYNPLPFVQSPGAELTNNLVRASRINPASVARALQRVKDDKLGRQDPDSLRAASPIHLGVKEAVHNTYGHGALYERANEAFLRRKLPKLRRELDYDRTTQLRALNSIVDIIDDPERISEAVREQIPQKLVKLMVDEDPRIRERCLVAMAILAATTVGQDALLGVNGMLQQLKALMMDGLKAVRFRAARALWSLLLYRTGSRGCVDELDLALYLITIITKEIDQCILKDHLFSFKLLLRLESTKERCIESGAYEMLNALIYLEDKEVVLLALEALSQLASCGAGQRQLFFSSLGFRRHLCSRDTHLANLAIRFLMQLTLPSKNNAIAPKRDLLDCVHNLATRKDNPVSRKLALQVIRNLTEYPECREYFEHLAIPLE